MTPSSPPTCSRQELLEEVLGEYMQRLDRGEAVDREQLLGRYPELAEELQSYFAGSDEVEQLRPHAGGKVPASSPAGAPAACPTADGGPCRLGDYELLELVGQGGMGLIYKARQISLQRLVAVKMIRTDRLASLADILRFQSEAEAVASLDHPHIVPIYEVGEHQGQHYFSMKLVEGGSLAGHLPRLAADLPAAAGLLAAVARAVHYAHQRGILHRDLKPANILLDGQGRPHVTDFGLAKRMAGPAVQAGGASLTQQGMIVGTPNYMAPEQAAAQGGVSTAADVYSLGAILYEVLTGRPPFRAETPLDTLLQVREGEPPPPHSLNRRVDRDLETVCLKCLRKDPHQRYASALALAEDLERWRAGKPIRCRPISRRERVLKWARRRPDLAGLAALLVLVLLAGFAGVFWQWGRAEEGHREAARNARGWQRTAYARAVSLAYAEWWAGNAGPAEEALAACPEELRGWEWHYLNRLFRARQLATLDGHAGGVLAVAFSPDGSRVASAGRDGAVKVWDRQTGRNILTLRGQAAVKAVTFSPDGRRLAGGSSDGIVRVWDVAGGERVAAWRAHAAGVTGLAFDPTGRRLASTGEGRPLCGELKLWDPADGKALAGGNWPKVLAAVAFSPDGRRLATACTDMTVAVWDAATFQPLGTLVSQSEWELSWASVAYSADGGWLAAASPSGVVRVWDAATARESYSALTPALTPVQAGVSGVAFTGRDARFLTAATANNTVQGWFTRTGKPAFTLRGHRRAVTAVACSPDGRCLASASLDETVKLWDISQLDEELTLRPHNQGLTGVAFSPDGARLAWSTQDKAVQVWDLAAGKAVVTLRCLPGAVNGLAFSPDGRRLATVSSDGYARLWDAADGRELRALDGGGPLCAVAFSPDGRHLAAAGAAGAWLWDAADGRELRALGGGPLYAVAFSPDGRRLAAGADKAVMVWDVTTGELARSLGGHAGAVRALAYGPGERLASAGDDGAVRVWDPVGQELLTLRGHTRTVRALSFSRAGYRLASAGDDQTIKVWDGTPLRQASAAAR